MAREAAVIGSPVAHSLSPQIFAFLAERAGLTDFAYRARDVGPAALPAFIEELRRSPAFLGVNVTIPHKEAVIAHLDALSPGAQAVGAVNVIHRDGEKLVGHNTDVFGIVESLKALSLDGGRALVLGAGGAARAAAYALGELGLSEVRVWNRNASRASALVAALASRFVKTRFEVATDPAAVGAVDLVVQATSVGMSRGDAGAETARLPFDLARLGRTPNAAAFDLVYAPERTPFLVDAEKLGFRTIGGLEMLIQQALATWRIFFGTAAPLPADSALQLAPRLRTLLGAQALRAPDDRPIFITGFMGAGKSTVAQLIARKLGWTALDLDESVVKTAGLSIPAIFEKLGEAQFRKLEHEALVSAAASPRRVVALGGGALTHPESLRLVLGLGRLVYLEASPETLERRLQSEAARRPLLAGLSDDERKRKIQKLLRERQGQYEKAHHRVRIDSRNASEVAELVIRSLALDSGAQA